MPQALLGIDVGATLTKLAIEDGTKPLHLELLPADATATALDRLRGIGARHVGLTGVGATEFLGAVDAPVARVDEFRAWGVGAHRLLRAEEDGKDAPYLLVSLGTGTSILRVDGDTTSRIGGSALGGGTVLGLCSALVPGADFDELCRLASRGSRRGVDLLVEDIDRRGELPLPGEITAASFGKLHRPSAIEGTQVTADRAEAADLAAAVMGLVGENIGLICAALAAAGGDDRVVFGGSTLRDNSLLRNILTVVTRANGREAVHLESGEFAGAVGALEMARTLC